MDQELADNWRLYICPIYRVTGGTIFRWEAWASWFGCNSSSSDRRIRTRKNGNWQKPPDLPHHYLESCVKQHRIRLSLVSWDIGEVWFTDSLAAPHRRCKSHSEDKERNGRHQISPPRQRIKEIHRGYRQTILFAVLVEAKRTFIKESWRKKYRGKDSSHRSRDNISHRHRKSCHRIKQSSHSPSFSFLCDKAFWSCLPDSRHLLIREQPVCARWNGIKRATLLFGNAKRHSASLSWAPCWKRI